MTSRGRTFALLALIAGCSGASTASPGPPNPLVGAWELVSYTDTPDGGAPIDGFGKSPRGLFVFTADMHVSISLMTNPRTSAQGPIDPDPDACVPDWYCSYFGTYSYDPSGPAWTTHVTGGNIASYLGTDQRRNFKLSGNELTISETFTAGGRTYRGKRVLRKLGP